MIQFRLKYPIRLTHFDDSADEVKVRPSFDFFAIYYIYIKQKKVNFSFNLPLIST
jgi:hypothetical protein